jgi:hypothetical protein
VKVSAEGPGHPTELLNVPLSDQEDECTLSSRARPTERHEPPQRRPACTRQAQANADFAAADPGASDPDARSVGRLDRLSGPAPLHGQPGGGARQRARPGQTARSPANRRPRPFQAPLVKRLAEAMPEIGLAAGDTRYSGPLHGATLTWPGSPQLKRTLQLQLIEPIDRMNLKASSLMVLQHLQRDVGASVTLRPDLAV